MAKKLIVFAFMAVFVSYCPCFGVPGWFTRPMTLCICLRCMTKKLVIFCVYGHVHDLLPTVLGFRGDLQGPWGSVHFWEGWQKKSLFFAFMAFFVSYCP
jgi:hypothetical protein